MRHLCPRQKEKSTVVGHLPEVPLALGRRPADEPVARGTLPGRRTKEQNGQVPPVTVADQIMQLAQRMRVTQVVMRPQVIHQARALGLGRPDPTHRERLQLRQHLGDRPRRTGRWRLGAANLPTTAAVLARWQAQTAPLLQPIEQQASGHIAQLPLAISPVPESGQLHRQRAAAPVGPLADPALELAQILRLEPATENADRANHAPELGTRSFWKPVISSGFGRKKFVPPQRALNRYKALGYYHMSLRDNGIAQRLGIPERHWCQGTLIAALFFKK